MACCFFLLPGPLAQLTLSQVPDQKKGPLYCSDFIINKTCLAPKWGKILKHNICVVQMQCSLFSCVTKANLDSDSALQPTTLNLNANTLSHAGSAHMWEASYGLSILSTSFVDERLWGQVPEQPPGPLPLRVQTWLFLKQSLGHHGVSQCLEGHFPSLLPPLIFVIDLWLPDDQTENLKFSCRKTNNSNSKTIQNIRSQPFECLPQPNAWN